MTGVPGESVPTRPVPDLAASRAHVLAIDLGTGGPKVAVLSGTGEIAAHSFEKVGLRLLPDGGAEQDPHEWWSAVSSAARRALADSGVPAEDIVGVGCTAQWSGTVAIGETGEPLCDAVIWMDSRGAGPVRRHFSGPAAGYKPRQVTRWIRLTAGAPSLSGKDPFGHIRYLRDARPEVYRAARAFLEPVDYLTLRMTDVVRASYDSITMYWLTDNRRLDQVAYDDGLLAVAGIERAKLPELVPTGSILGGLTPGAAGDLSLLPGTPVVAGSGDLHTAAVGSGAAADFAAHLYIGTSSWISCHVPFKKTSVSTNIASLPAGLPGKYLVADEHETAGACLTWLRDNLVYGQDGLGSAHEPDDVFAVMNDVAAKVPPGANGVLFTPWLNGERSPVDDHMLRGGFHNLSLSSTREDMVRAVFEGVAFNNRWLLGAVERFMKRPVERLAFVGGGANSDLWSQLHADVTGRTIRQMADPVLANARGAGLLALLSLGRVRREDISSLVPVKAEYRPDPSAGRVYEQMAEEFVKLYKSTKGMYRRLNRTRLAGGRGEGKTR